MNLMQLLGVRSKETLGGRYKLIQPLGQGGFGHTFLATDLHLPDHPTCVIKQLKPHLRDAESLTTARRLFETEARVLYQLGEHSQIPRLLAHFEDGQEFYLAQELVEGESLSELVLPGQHWSEGRVRQLLTEILTPLAFVHEQGVIHRDLKPSNLIHRRADGHIVLIDFGAVKQVSERRNHQQATRTISIGTQGYMPSEQLAGNPWFSSDIYALGMICLQALTGIAPHKLRRDPHTSEVVWQSPDLDISEAFKAVLARMVRYDFRDRYPTATEVLTDVRSLPDSPNEPIFVQSKNIPSSLPTQVVAPAKPESSLVAGSSAVAPVDQRTIDTAPMPSTPTLAVEKLGLPRLPQSLQTITKATVAVVPLSSSMGRWSILGLSVLTVVALGLFRNEQPSPNLVSQPSEAATTITNAGETVPPEALTATPPELEAEDPPADSVVKKVPKPSAETTTPEPVVNTITKPSPDIENPSEESSVDELLAKASKLRDRNQYNDALQIYEQLLERNPEKAEVYWGQCYSLNQLQDYDQAIEACDLALEIAPDHVQSLWSKGYALEQQGQSEDALALYDQTLALDPDYIEAWNNRGGILFQQQRFQEALAAFNRAREIDPNFAEAWNNRGAALWELRQFEDAIASIDQAIKLQPDYPEAQSLRAQIRDRLGR
ncbi:MAG: tetratricopeptide repeat protein [Leptolyngbya sp. SIO3F4]|nr:tetratricopeptide repeat protein [Leptolyngbya sp. SIO3F4]